MSGNDLFPIQRRTGLPGGYMGKILRVNLSSASTKDENLPEEPVLRQFMGGQALASYILLKELPLDAQPFGSENRLVIMTGPIRLHSRRDQGHSSLSQSSHGLFAGKRSYQWLLGNLP